MAQQYLNNGDEREAPAQPANEPERREAPHEDVAAEETSSRADESVESVESLTMPVASPRKRRNKSEDNAEPQADQTDHADAGPEDTSSAAVDDDLRELEALGFTRDEATRLIDVSIRITHSHEALDAEATRKRLQFAKWLVERGVLDEFSVRSE